MASSSGSKDSFGVEIDSIAEGKPYDEVEVDWSELVPDDSLISDDGDDASSDNGDNEEGEKPPEEYEGSSGDEGDVIVYKIIDRVSLFSDCVNDSCICRDPIDVSCAMSLMEAMMNLDITTNNYFCIIDNIIRSINCVFSSTKKVIDKRRLAITDLFFKIRHEILFKVLCKSYSLPATQSDQSFENYCIKSNRTPDLLLMVNDVLMILEVSASSNYERAAQQKGLGIAGYESKYKLEMDLLNDSGISNVYVPVIFDMANTYGEINKEQLTFLDGNFKKNQTYFSLLKSLCKQLSIISNELKNTLLVSASILFSDPIEIIPNHESHKFLYTTSHKKLPKINRYKEMIVSPQIFNKVNNNWSRFYYMLESTGLPDNVPINFFINTSSHRFYIDKRVDGICIPDYMVILNNNDKIEFFKNLYIIAGTSVMRATDCEGGVKFWERQRIKDNNQEKFSNLQLMVSHSALKYQNNEFDFSKYEIISKKAIDYNMISIHFDPDYEDKILSSIAEIDKENYFENPEGALSKCLGNSETGKIDIDTVMMEIKKEYIGINKRMDTMPLIINKMKSPFILPLSSIHRGDYGSIRDKPIELIIDLIKELGQGNPFTVKILENVKDPEFELYKDPKVASYSLRKLYNNRISVSNQINQLQKELYRKGTTDGIFKISRTEDVNYKPKYLILKKEYNNLMKEIKSRQQLEGVKNETSFVRLSTKGKGSTLRGMYEIEMSHFRDKKKQSTLEGVGVRSRLEDDFEKDNVVFNDINTQLIMNHGINPDPLIDYTETKDAKLLSDLKKIAVDEYKDLIETVKNSALGHASALISRLAHSLMYYSQLPFSSEYVRVDNLGYKNVLLIVKGGKKIFKSKGSKLYRLIYPILESTIPWYTMGHRQQSSTIIIRSNDRPYAITPWQIMHESTLCEAISFYPRVCSFVVLNSNPKVELKTQYNRLSLNVLLSFHNRRQTEVLLANLRYILLSTLGDYTGVAEILIEFFGFNYDCFQAFVRGCILYNYPDYFKQLNELKSRKANINNKEITLGDFIKLRLKNIFTGMSLNSTEDLALMIYSTFLMTKAPYQRSVERANNLKGILKIHDEYINTVGSNFNPKTQLEKISVTIKDSYKDYADELFSNDFKFDPKYCALIGNFIDSVYRNQGDTDDLHSSWIRIINKTWDELSTSTGLRGEYNDVETFWGKKGYFVVYKKLLEDFEFRNKMTEILTSSKDDDAKRKMVKDINITYFEKITVDREFLIFHAVDKVQWRGGREIYVMDLMTKTMQQPIEQFMAELCKRLDNELISIPSDKRSQVIHHTIFEKDLPVKNLLTWYLTLDCRKWAPKSIFSKFAITILNMFTIPTSFKVHFLNYIEKLYNKRVYFNKGEVKVLMNNNLYTSICKRYLKYDENVKGYYLEMQYSWVMGIFNYTSSFLHAANQKYFSYILMKSSLLNYKEESNLVMFAHSDDSGGRLTVSSPSMAKRALILYEVNLKACNHLISKKKSVVSRIYFEILSVIYMFKQLLALLPKFLGGLRFMPTDKGPAQDMLQSYSKCIEVLVSGANFNVAYLVMKFYSMMIWRFYYNRTITIDDYNRPVQYLGMPDAHPLMCLLCGSDAEILRLLENENDLINLVSFVQTVLKTAVDAGPIKPIKFEIKVRGISKGFEDYIEGFKEYIDKWSVRNVNYHNSLFNTLNFLGKLNDAGFVGSLVNESTTRRISRCYYIRSGDSCITTYGNLKLRTITDSFLMFQNFVNKDNAVKMILDEILSSESIQGINDEINLKFDSVKKQMTLMKKTLYSPLKIYKYLNNLSMEGRGIIDSTRTLKPTVLQLSKTAKVFSADFDPSSLVSYIKEPELRWAITDPRGLITAQEEVKNFFIDIGYDINDVDNDDLLRVCRTYGRESVKMIYMYSRVPSELRQIKSYSAFLTFLSVNTFDNKEIEGLVLKLSGRDAVRDYNETNINEEIYLINNIISMLNVFYTKLDMNFLNSCKINPIDEIVWEGGKLKDFIGHIMKILEQDVHYSLLYPQLIFLNNKINEGSMNGSSIIGGAYYTFLKSQRVKSGWFGSGEIVIVVEKNFYSFDLFNTEIRGVSTNRTGKLPLHHSDYIRDVFNHTNINYNSLMKKRPLSRLQDKNFFGHDVVGNLTVAPEREVVTGVPCKVTEKRGGFLEELHFYQMLEIYKDHILLKSDLFERPTYKKVYFLPIKKAEIMPIILKLFDKNDFQNKLMEEGLNEFEEYVLTEIMTEYGVNNYIGFNEFLDGYTGSKIYDIFKQCRDKNICKIPQAAEKSIIPAPQGSLARILIEYSNYTKDRVMETPKSLDPIIMEIRSEYPENTSVVLSELLVNNIEQMYDKVELKEIHDSYHKLYKSEDIDEVRNSIIKLLTFWGYGGLVNSITGFSMVKHKRNYIYFNLNICDSEKIVHFQNYYPKLINMIIQVMFNWESYYSRIDVPFKHLVYSKDMKSVVNNYVSNSCIEAYNYNFLEVNHSLETMEFYNIFSGLLKEDEFVAELQYKMNSDYILGSLEVNYQNRKNFINLINNLKDCWMKSRVQRYNLDPLVKLQRIPDNLVNYRNFIKEFEVKIPPANLYYHGFLSEKIINHIKEPIEISVGKIKYRVSSKIKHPSDQTVPANTVIKFKRPLKEDILDTEEWENLDEELKMVDLDEDEINYLWSEIKDPYKPKTTRVMNVMGNKLVRSTVYWVPVPYRSCTFPKLDSIRQVGENVVVISNTYFRRFCSFFPNSGVRLVNYGNKNMYAHYTLDNILNKIEFINKYIGGVQINYDDSVGETLCIGYLRDADGEIKKALNLGSEDVLKEFSENIQYVEEEGVIKPVKKDDSSKTEKDESTKGQVEDENNGFKEEGNVSQKPMRVVNEEIDKLKIKGLSENSINKLKDKYLSRKILKGAPLSTILESLLVESELNLLNENILNNKIDLTSGQQTSAFLTPEYYGMSYSLNKSTDSKAIKDPKVVAELGAIHKSLVPGVGSCTIMLSDNFRKTINSHLKLWRNTIKSTRYKRENKMFLYTLILSIVNSAKPGSEEHDDYIWQDIINRGTDYIADEPDSEEDDNEFMMLMLDFIASTRLRYRPEGM